VGMNKTELRGVWLTNEDSDVLFSQSAIAEALDKLASFNFNTLYPTIWQGGYTLYESAVAEKYFGKKQHPQPELAGRNPLIEMIDHNREKKYGFAIIPWFEFGLMAPSGSELDKKHPDWFTQDIDGNRVRYSDKEPRVWLNLLMPEVQNFIEELLVEIITKHNVDGIQLDDHFGMPVEFGYDSFTEELYKNEHSGTSRPDNCNDEDWKKWRATKITEFLQRLFSTIKNHKRNCIISLSPNPIIHSFDNYLQNWTCWERRGLVEELVLQVYRDNMVSFIKEIDKDEVINKSRKHIPTVIGIMTGTRSEPDHTIDLIKQQLEESIQRQYGGVSFFFYESLWKNKDLFKETNQEREQLFKNMFPEKAIHPNIYNGWQPPT
jgi:uncharacterized lipoprotein YddW (UPF0748 family)